MAVQSYKDLIVWQRAMELVTQIYKETKSFPKEEMYGLTSQLRRAAVSIPSNIAEGHARHLDGAGRLVRRIGKLGELPTGIDQDDAALAVAIATADSSWYFAVDTGGKTWDEAEVIFANTVTRMLLGPRAISANCG